MIDPRGYSVIYDVAREPVGIGFFVFHGVIAVAIFLMLAFTTRQRFWRVLAPVLAAAFLVLAGLSQHWEAREHAFLQAAMRDGSFELIEGVVTSLRYGRRDCREVSFEVADREFAFSTCDHVAGYDGSGLPDLRGACAKLALVWISSLQAHRIAWMGVRRSGCAGLPPPTPTRQVAP